MTTAIRKKERFLAFIPHKYFFFANDYQINSEIFFVMQPITLHDKSNSPRILVMQSASDTLSKFNTPLHPRDYIA